MYEIEFSETVEKEIKKKKLDTRQLDELNERLEKLKLAPDAYGKPLRRPLAGVWEIRFERRYRILYIIDDQRKIVTIVGLKHKDEM
ncbi:MAG: type II toxin-antitoxin system RelE/ParE family toxin [Candidatus Aenigmarchaeota archaeon]|nr:type II toxin-antitoxin system RelE/ParE family toxin [Candidatus Aenigmarchaeota archaeon]